MALNDLNARIEAATVQLEADTATVTATVGSLTAAVTSAQASASTATTKANEASTSASTASTAATRAETALADIDSKGYIGDAPKDGNQYARKDGAWDVVTGGGSGGGAVDSVNGKVGVVVLTAADVKALPDTTPLFSGNYNDLTGKPALFSGSYNDLTDKPALKPVATSGAYADLTGKPTILAEAPADGKLYGRKSGTWAEVPTGGGVPVNPTLTGSVTINATPSGEGAVITSKDQVFDISIPPVFTGGQPEGRLYYGDLPNNYWYISRNGGPGKRIATMDDLNITAAATPFLFNNTVNASGPRIRVMAANPSELGLQAVSSGNSPLGYLSYSNTVNKWMLKHTNTDGPNPIATEKFVTDAIAAIPTPPGGGGGAPNGRRGGVDSLTQRTSVVDKLIPTAEVPSGATSTWAGALAMLASQNMSDGGSFVFSQPTLTLIPAQQCYAYPLSGTSTKTTAATHRLEVFPNKDSTGTVTSIDFFWTNLSDKTRHWKNAVAANYTGVSPWTALQ